MPIKTLYSWSSRQCHGRRILQIRHDNGGNGQHETRHDLLSVVIEFSVGKGNTRAVDGNPSCPLETQHQGTHAKNHAQNVHIIRDQIVVHHRLSIGPATHRRRIGTIEDGSVGHHRWVPVIAIRKLESCHAWLCKKHLGKCIFFQTSHQGQSAEGNWFNLVLLLFFANSIKYWVLETRRLKNLRSKYHRRQNSIRDKLKREGEG